MRFRVKRPEYLNLKKALDKTKLVLVDVQANGKNGAYQTKRWKNPNQGLKIAEEQIKSQAKKEGSLVYKNKNLGTIEMGETVTKKYLANRKNPNISLTQFIKDNYTIQIAEKGSNLFNLIQKIQSTETNTDDRTDGDSLSKHTDENGKLTPEREALHREIILNHFIGKEPAKGEKTFIILGGGSASGKSTLLKSGLIEKTDGFVTIDSDNIKGMLPEYNEMIKNGNDKAAGYTHEESSAITKRTQKISLELGYNTILDGTGDGSEKSLMNKIKQGKDNGYRVKGEYVTIPTKLALERANDRAKKTGRKIREDKIKEIHQKVSIRALQFADIFDEIKVYDNTNKITLIADGGNGEKLKARKGYEGLFADFVQKGESNE